MSKYKVSFLIGNIYEVVERETDEVLHQGSLADCEAWIRLEEGGYF